MYYLNHPVQFVCLVGVVVAFDEYFDKFWLFTIDDSSGSTIDVTCRKPAKENEAGKQQGTGAQNSKTNKAKDGSLDDDEEEDDENARNTMMSHLDIGTVVKAKGTITTFRNVRQIQLERITVIPDTNAEMRFWDQRTTLLVDVLSKPWTLSEDKQKKLHKEAQGEEEHDKGRTKRRREREAKKLAREKKDAQRIARNYEREERERQLAAEEAKKDGMALRDEIEEETPQRTMVGRKKASK